MLISICAPKITCALAFVVWAAGRVLCEAQPVGCCRTCAQGPLPHLALARQVDQEPGVLLDLAERDALLRLLQTWRVVAGGPVGTSLWANTAAACPEWVGGGGVAGGTPGQRRRLASDAAGGQLDACAPVRDHSGPRPPHGAQQPSISVPPHTAPHHHHHHHWPSSRPAPWPPLPLPPPSPHQPTHHNHHTHTRAHWP